jgi:hypothetical protein
MELKDFDVVGVRRDGEVVGYVDRADLGKGTLEKHVKEFPSHLLLNETNSIVEAMELLSKSMYVFVLIMDQVSGIITKGDLQKTPVRMWLFGILSLLEMQFLRLIRDSYPKDEWKSMINPGRLEKAQAMLNDRKRRNEAIDLADCLQFADKRTIILQNEHVWRGFGFLRKREAEDYFEKLEELRNELAHAQDIISGRWPGLVSLAKRAEKVLGICEELEAEPKS